jgi:hypothetical protein
VGQVVEGAFGAGMLSNAVKAFRTGDQAGQDLARGSVIFDNRHCNVHVSRHHSERKIKCIVIYNEDKMRVEV